MKQMYYMRRCRWSSDWDKDDINLVNKVNCNMVVSPMKRGRETKRDNWESCKISS